MIIEGGGREKMRISLSITDQSNVLPSDKLQTFQFRLHEHPSLGWQPQLSADQFMTILNNITAMKIRGSYFTPGEGFIDSVELETALVRKFFISKENI